MADNVDLAALSGTCAADEVTDGTLGSVKVQYVKIMDGTLDGTSKAAVGANGLAVSAKQSGTWTVDAITNVVHVDDNSGALSVDDGGSSLTVDYATTGSGNATGALRVEIANNGTGLVGLNAGTNAIGKLAANSGVDIGDVDVTSVIAGTGATNLGKAEDAVHGSGDTGVMSLAVRNDAGTALAADGDYIPLTVNSAGALYVTGGGGGTQYVEDAAAASDPTGTMLIAVRRDTLSTSEVTADGDNIALKASSKGKLHVAAETRFGDTVADTGSGTGGSATQRIIIDSSQLGSLGQTTMSASAPVVIASDQSKVPVHGNTAHDSPDADKPLKVGGYAKAAAPTDVSADADVVNAWFLRNGAQATVVTAAGALIGGDATNGLDVDVTRVSGNVAVTVASGAVASGAISSGAVASGAVASGAFASGSIASGAIAAGAIAAGATSIADNEDAVSNDGDRGVKILAVRKATPANTSGNDGDYEFLQMSGGYLHIHGNKGFSNKAFTATFTTLTRPANTTAYAAADSISDNATAGSVTALSATVSDVNDDPVFISEILVSSTDTGLAGKKIRAYLFNSNPTSSSGVGAGDNAAYSQKVAGYIGSFMGWMETGFSDGTVGRLVPCFNETNFTQAGGFVVTLPTSGAATLYIQYQAVEAFTPSANSTTIIGKARGWQGRAA